MRVFIEERDVVPFIEDDGSLSAAFDADALETVASLQESIGQLSRMLILQQFNFEQRIRSQGNLSLSASTTQ